MAKYDSLAVRFPYNIVGICRSYILYQNFTIPEKWGGGKQYY